MNKFFYSLVCCVLLTFLSGCNKNTSYKIEGTITNNTENKGLENAKVSIYSNGIGNDSELVVSSTTDANGKYTLQFERQKTQNYTMLVEKDGYFKQTKQLNSDDILIDETNTFNFNTTAKAWVRIRFVRSFPENYIAYIKQEGKQKCEECCGNSRVEFSNKIPSDTSIYCINDGNTKYSIAYSINKIPSEEIKGVITTPFDTTELLIQY